MNHNKLFVILASNLGIKFAPHGHTVLNNGVTEGGSAISKEITTPSDEVLQISFSKIADTNNQQYLKNIFDQYQQATNQILKHWNKKVPLVCLGGDHSVAYISLSAVIQKYGQENVCLIMFDSHADLHLPTTSPSSNFHGMWLRSLINSLNDSDFTKQIKFVGNLITQETENKYIDQKNIEVYSSDDISPNMAKSLLNWSKKFAHLHISFDIDVFMESLVSATGTPNKNGLSKAQVLTVLNEIKKHQSISLDIVELNPQKSGAKKSLELINNVYNSIFK
ncbi:MAG: arginase family protein [Candidatus Pacebacteria bacterium]|nr:arginase family protein [Candidatus Paceibacterota bacterium]